MSNFFFFSSRRRHTRLQGDWSSDVCSSDLGRRLPERQGRGEGQGGAQGRSQPARPGSEERRVGKECRSRWSPYHENKKISTRSVAFSRSAVTASSSTRVASGRSE